MSPVGTSGLLGLRLLELAVLAQRFGAAAWALPHRRHVGFDRHGDLEIVPLRARVADVLAGGELDASLVLEALTAEAGTAQSALSHEPPPGGVGCICCV